MYVGHVYWLQEAKNAARAIKMITFFIEVIGLNKIKVLLSINQATLVVYTKYLPNDLSNQQVAPPNVRVVYPTND